MILTFFLVFNICGKNGVSYDADIGHFNIKPHIFKHITKEISVTSASYGVLYTEYSLNRIFFTQKVAFLIGTYHYTYYCSRKNNITTRQKKTSPMLFQNLLYAFRKPPLYFLKDKNVGIVSYYSHPTVTCFMIGFHQLDGIP